MLEGEHWRAWQRARCIRAMACSVFDLVFGMLFCGRSRRCASLRPSFLFSLQSHCPPPLPLFRLRSCVSWSRTSRHFTCSSSARAHTHKHVYVSALVYSEGGDREVAEADVATREVRSERQSCETREREVGWGRGSGARRSPANAHPPAHGHQTPSGTATSGCVAHDASRRGGGGRGAKINRSTNYILSVFCLESLLIEGARPLSSFSLARVCVWGTHTPMHDKGGGGELCEHECVLPTWY